MQKASYSVLVLVPVLLMSADVRAQSSGLYIGVGAGISHANFTIPDFDPGRLLVSAPETKGVGAGLFGGFSFNKTWAIELGYVNLGTFDFEYTTGQTSHYAVSGFTLSALGALSVSDDLSVFVRVGAFDSTVKNSGLFGANCCQGGLQLPPGSHTTTKPCFGVGAQYDFVRSFSGRLEYEDYGEVGNSDDTGRAKMSLISANLLYRF